MITNFSPFSSGSGEQLNKAFTGHVFILILSGHETNESVLLSVLSTLPSLNSFSLNLTRRFLLLCYRKFSTKINDQEGQRKAINVLTEV